VRGWIFFGLSGLALFVFRRRDGLKRSNGVPLMVRVPGYGEGRGRSGDWGPGLSAAAGEGGGMSVERWT
jgi:hypothetical protein